MNAAKLPKVSRKCVVSIARSGILLTCFQTLGYHTCSVAAWPSGKAGACKALIPGSNPGAASNHFIVDGGEATSDFVQQGRVVELAYTTDLKSVALWD
jgi:hypothetical protein